LRSAPGLVQLVMGDTDLTPWDMGTFGSRTTPTMAPELRRMASTARETLLAAAAKTWNVEAAQLKMADGHVSDPGGKTTTIGELAAKIDWVRVLGKPDFVTPPKQWQVAGTSLTKVNVREIVTGKHKYPSDYKLPGMLYGRVLRPPSFGAKLISADTSAASKIPGVSVVRDGDFIGVAATDEQKAQTALLSIDAKWDQQKQISSKDLFAYIRAVVGVGPIPVGSIHNTAQKNTKNQTKKTRPRQQNPKKYKKTN
jgi:CO/xanthine dehydrogenase Mo-binding subunit